MKLINDKYFKVVLDHCASSPQPAKAIWKAQHCTVTDDFAPDKAPPLNCSNAIIHHQLNVKHYSVLDFAFVKLDFKGFPHDCAMQMRVHQGKQSMLVQCLTADAEITILGHTGSVDKSRFQTIGYMYESWSKGRYNFSAEKMQAAIKKFRLRCLNEDTGEFTIGHIKDIFSTGVNPVYKIVTDDGYEVTSTLNHKYWTEAGWQTLGDLANIVTNPLTGNIDSIANILPAISTNGVTIGDGLYQKKEWLEAHLANGLTSKEIAVEAGVGVEAIKKWVYKHELKLNIRDRKGDPAWNKGMKGEYQLTCSDARRLADKERGEKRKGDKSNLWKGGLTNFRGKVSNWALTQKIELNTKYHGKCIYCQDTKKLEIDHILPVSTHPELAFVFENLQLLCEKCHRNKTGWDCRTVPKWSKIASITFAGYQETYDIEMEGKHHSFIANGFVVHNSMRYTGSKMAKCGVGEIDPEELFYAMPAGKYGSRDGTWEYTDRDRRSYLTNCQFTAANYANAINEGVPEEAARRYLAAGYRQNFTMAGTVRSMWHMLCQRTLADSQIECRTAAQLALNELIRWEPGLFNWFDENLVGKNQLAP